MRDFPSSFQPDSSYNLWQTWDYAQKGSPSGEAMLAENKWKSLVRDKTQNEGCCPHFWQLTKGAGAVFWEEVVVLCWGHVWLLNPTWLENNPVTSCPGAPHIPYPPSWYLPTQSFQHLLSPNLLPFHSSEQPFLKLPPTQSTAFFKFFLCPKALDFTALSSYRTVQSSYSTKRAICSDISSFICSASPIFRVCLFWSPSQTSRGWWWQQLTRFLCFLPPS